MAASAAASLRTLSLALALVCCGAAAATQAGPDEAPCAGVAPHVHWLSSGVGVGETVMVVGWCLGDNPTLLLDDKIKLGVTVGIGGPRHNYTEYGQPRSLMSKPLPDGGHHTLAVVTADGQTSNTMRLNDADLWWVQGDEGEAATAGGWIRAFGRGLVDDSSGGASAAAQAPPAALQRDWAQLAGHGGWDNSVQLERLRELVTTHGDWLSAPRAAPATTLTLTPLGESNAALGESRDTSKKISLAAAKDASTFAAEFAIPASTPPGNYSVSISNGAGGAPSALDCYENPNRTRVRSIEIKTAAPSRQQRPIFYVDGPSGLNHTSDPSQVPAYGTKGDGRPIDATPIFKAALAQAGAVAGTSGGATVAFRAGVFHIDGPILVPHGVAIIGAGSDLTAIYFSYDNISSAPQILLGPSVASNAWGIEDLTVYVLGFFRTVIHIPADETGQSRFRMNRVTVRADAFHCQNGMAGHGKRAPPWFPNCDGTCGTQGGYKNAVMHLGRLENISSTQKPVLLDVSTGVKNTPAVNVQVQDCDISSSWHIFQGNVQHFVARNNVLWNGGMAFYLIPRESIIEGNDATGSSVISGGGGYNFAQHLYHGNNRIRNIHGNDREVMTFDGEDNVYYGTATEWNETHVITPNCPGRPDSRFPDALFSVAGSQLMIVDGPGTGQYRRVITGDMPTSGQCFFAIDKPFDGLNNVPLGNITFVVAAFTGRNIFDRNTFEDGGPFQFYNSGVHDIASGMTFRRTEGAWNSGMDVAASLRNGSKNNAHNGCPNPSYFNEFTNNNFEVGHRAPHLGSPSLQNRDLFWNQVVAKFLFSMGMAGQGRGHSNRFIVFRRNSFVGANGIKIWGIGSSDVLVENNRFNGTNISIALDHFPTNVSAVTNVVIRGNREL